MEKENFTNILWKPYIKFQYPSHKSKQSIFSGKTKAFLIKSKEWLITFDSKGNKTATQNIGIPFLATSRHFF